MGTVWAQGNFGQGGGGGGGPIIVTNNVTTADAIRDRVIALISAVVPTKLAADRFKAFQPEGDGDFVAWCQSKPDAAFRRFLVRDLDAVDRHPRVSNTDVEEHFVTLEIAIAYPQTARTGPKLALGRDDVSTSDRHQIEQQVGVNGYGNFVGATFPNATPLPDDDPAPRRVKLDGCDLLVITQTYRFYRRMVP